jgi:hypothetical protein
VQALWRFRACDLFYTNKKPKTNGGDAVAKEKATADDQPTVSKCPCCLHDISGSTRRLMSQRFRTHLLLSCGKFKEIRSKCLSRILTSLSALAPPGSYLNLDPIEMTGVVLGGIGLHTDTIINKISNRTRGSPDPRIEIRKVWVHNAAQLCTSILLVYDELKSKGKLSTKKVDKDTWLQLAYKMTQRNKEDSWEKILDLG